MRQDAVFEVKLKALKTRFSEQPQESRNVDLLPLIMKMHLETFTKIFSAFPHEERSSDFYRLFKDGCRTFCRRQATFGSNQSIGRNFAQTTSGNLSTAFDRRVVLAESFI